MTTITRLILIPATAGALCLVPSLAAAATIDVTTFSDEASDNTTCSLREAVTSANDNSNGGEDACVAGEMGSTDVITLHAGTYALGMPGASEDGNATGDLDPFVSASQGDLEIDGAGTAATEIDAGDLDRAVDSHAGTLTLTLKNLTLDNGTTPPTQLGGVLRVSNSGNAVLSSVAVTNGVSPNFGGAGIDDSSSGTLTLTGSTVSGNTVNTTITGDFGAGIHQVAGTLNLIDSTVSNNHVNKTGMGVGATMAGGGVSSVNSTLNLTRSTVSGNSVDMLTGGNIDLPSGGGIASQDTTASIVDSTLSSNTLSGGMDRSGAGYWHVDPTSPTPDNRLTIQNSTFSGNSAGAAPALGGGLNIAGGAVTVTASTFSNNAASAGEAIYGQKAMAQTGGALTVREALINEGAGACAFPNFLSATSAGYNADGGSSCALASGTDQQSAAISLGSLQGNGGTTQTHALLSGSAGIDSVPAVSCQEADGDPLIADQRGYPRPFPGGGACDIGAYERFTCAGVPLDQPGAFTGCPVATTPATTAAKKCKKKKRKKRSAAAAKKKCKKKKKKKRSK